MYIYVYCYPAGLNIDPSCGGRVVTGNIRNPGPGMQLWGLGIGRIMVPYIDGNPNGIVVVVGIWI